MMMVVVRLKDGRVNSCEGGSFFFFLFVWLIWDGGVYYRGQHVW